MDASGFEGVATTVWATTTGVGAGVTFGVTIGATTGLGVAGATTTAGGGVGLGVLAAGERAAVATGAFTGVLGATDGITLLGSATGVARGGTKDTTGDAGTAVVDLAGALTGVGAGVLTVAAAGAVPCSDRFLPHDLQCSGLKACCENSHVEAVDADVVDAGVVTLVLTGVEGTLMAGWLNVNAVRAGVTVAAALVVELGVWLCVDAAFTGVNVGAVNVLVGVGTETGLAGVDAGAESTFVGVGAAAATGADGDADPACAVWGMPQFLHLPGRKA